jgi:hypothetical protein
MSKSVVGTLAAAVLMAASLPASGHQSSGAIFTTLPDGSAVNFNIYGDKYDVYLDGGPGQNAPQHAAGLDDGIYVFQVTDPSGKTLLSEDIAACRRVVVSNGVIAGLVTDGCPSVHVTGTDVDWGATTVQLMPYADTPNNGGEYKAWMTYVEDFLTACEANGVANGLAVVDCGLGHRGNFHGFLGRHSKTDNFKVGGQPRELDTRFHAGSVWGDFIDGLAITWTDTLGASNRKWSYLDPSHYVFHEAHVENVEDGTHYITVDDQLGCKVGEIAVDGRILSKPGPQTVSVKVTPGFKGDTLWVDVACVQ